VQIQVEKCLAGAKPNGELAVGLPTCQAGRRQQIELIQQQWLLLHVL
jgi:hypothetical protein